MRPNNPPTTGNANPSVTSPSEGGPLDQFEIHNFFFFRSISVAAIINILWWLTMNFGSIILAGGFLIPSTWQAMHENFLEFLQQTIKDQLGRITSRYFILLSGLFTTVWLCNIVGLVPGFLRITAQIGVCMVLSFRIVMGVTFLGGSLYQSKSLRLFLPDDAPLPLLPFLVVIEAVSYIFRMISLGVRLFANMMAGHTLVHILISFAVPLTQASGLLFRAVFPLTGLIVAILGLEFGVAFLQAYVFLILTCIYLLESLKLHG